MDFESLVQGELDNYNNRAYSTNLNDFLTKFSDSSGKYVNQLNTQNTFEVKFKFHPTLDISKNNTKKDLLDTLTSMAADKIVSSAKNAVNNMTGGLLASLMYDPETQSVLKLKDNFANDPTNSNKSFLHYLLPANYLVGAENTQFGEAATQIKPLEIQLGYYVQNITIPQIKMPEGKKSITPLGEFTTNGSYVIPDNNQLQLTILNTKLPIIERIFYPWLREVTLPWWTYETQPYTTATVTVDFSKHTDMQYVFCGCRPQQIQTMQPSQENDQSFQRTVTLIFDYMFITSKLTTMPSTKERLYGAAGTLGKTAVNMIM